MTDYFVSSSAGNDTNTGLSHEQAFASITHVNTLLNNNTITRGDTVRFNRGDTFYGKLRPQSLTFTRAGDVRFMPYSVLDINTKPILSSYKLLNIEPGWTMHAVGVWKISLSDANHGTTHTGYDGAQGGETNIGFLKVDGMIYGAKKFTLGELSTAWDFYNDGADLYVKSSANPTTLADDIRAAPDGDGITVGSSQQIIGLKVVGSGGHGIAGSSRRSYIYGNEITECGGSALVGYGDGTTRYGNGIQLWIGSKDSLIEYNMISEIYDAAYSIQGSESSITPNIPRLLNIHFRKNLIHHCAQSVEFWMSGTQIDGAGFINCTVTDNVCLFAGGGRFTQFRPTFANHVHILTYGWDFPDSDLLIGGNVFYDATSAHMYSSLPTPGLTRTGNIVMLRAGTKMMYQDADTIEDAEGWAVADGNDVGTIFGIIPDGEGMNVNDALAWLAESYSLPHSRRMLARLVVIEGQTQAVALA
ncbi:MAG: hypothetical protein WC829_03405 [Hyphomicrobium sp.]